MCSVSLEEAKHDFSRLIQQVMEGEEIVILDHNQPVARLIPVVREDTRPMFGSARGLITIADDFDEPLEEFEEYS